jgi:hypothetical protein
MLSCTEKNRRGFVLIALAIVFANKKTPVTVGGFGLPLRRNEKSADPPVTGVFELLNFV